MFACWKNDLFFRRGRDQNGGEKTREGRLEVAKTGRDFFGPSRDQFGQKKVVVTFWSGATKAVANFVCICTS